MSEFNLLHFFCISHSSLTSLFIITANTENRPTAVMYLLSQAGFVLTIFSFSISFLPSRTKENIFLFVGLFGRGVIFSAVLMEYFKILSHWVMDLKTARHQLHCREAHVQILKFKHAFKCFVGSGLASAAFYYTNDHKFRRKTLTALEWMS